MNKIGARIIKTGVSVTIALSICKWLKLEPSVFAAVAAVINLQPSVYFSLKTSLDQIKIHTLGIITGISVGYLFGGNPLTMGLVAMMIIYMYKRLKLQNGIIMGIVAALFILGSPQDQFLINALNRTAVIIIGLSASAIINVLLWPPHYERKLIEKLREVDISAVNYFCHAVDDFVNLDWQEIHSHEEMKNKLYGLISEARQLMDYIHDESKFRYDNAKVLDYVEGIAEKADRIYEITPIRIERRHKYGNPPVSEEYRAILDLLASGCDTIARVNEDIRLLICDNIVIERQKVHEHYWTKLTTAIEDWQQHWNSSYYVHGMIDVSVVANEIRWVSREGKKIINSLLDAKDLL